MILADFAYLVLRALSAENQFDTPSVQTVDTLWHDRVVIEVRTHDGKRWYIHCVPENSKEV